MTVLAEAVSFLLISDASQATAEIFQDGGELLLLIASVAVVVGLFGEMRSEKWIPAPSRIKTWHGAFVWMVVVGVAGELIADGAIFSGSHRLETISNTKLKDATDRLAIAEMHAAGRLIKPGLFDQFVFLGLGSGQPSPQKLHVFFRKYDAESEVFARSLRNELNQYGWNVWLDEKEDAFFKFKAVGVLGPFGGGPDTTAKKDVLYQALFANKFCVYEVPQEMARVADKDPATISIIVSPQDRYSKECQ